MTASRSPDPAAMFTARQSLEAEPCNYCREPATVFFSLNPEATPDICPACFVTALGFAEPDAETFTLLPKRSPAGAALPARAPDPDPKIPPQQDKGEQRVGAVSKPSSTPLGIVGCGDVGEEWYAEQKKADLRRVGAPRLPEPSPEVLRDALEDAEELLALIDRGVTPPDNVWQDHMTRIRAALGAVDGGGTQT